MITCFHRKMAAVAQSRGLAVASADRGVPRLQFRAGTHKWAGELGPPEWCRFGARDCGPRHVIALYLRPRPTCKSPRSADGRRDHGDPARRAASGVKGVLVTNLAIITWD